MSICPAFLGQECAISISKTSRYQLSTPTARLLIDVSEYRDG